MTRVSALARTGGAVAFCLVAGACSIGAPAAFTVTGASVDPAYTCPFGAADNAYDLHGIVRVRNGTSSTVTIDAVTAVLTLASVHGPWLEPVGATYDPGAVVVSPTAVRPTSSTALSVTIHSSCTNGKGQSTVTSYADYSVALTITTSSGRFRIVSGNRHRIIPA